MNPQERLEKLLKWIEFEISILSANQSNRYKEENNERMEVLCYIRDHFLKL